MALDAARAEWAPGYAAGGGPARSGRTVVGAVDRRRGDAGLRARRGADRVVLGVGLGAGARPDGPDDPASASNAVICGGRVDPDPVHRAAVLAMRSLTPLARTPASTLHFYSFAGKFSTAREPGSGGRLCYSSVHQLSTPRRADWIARNRGVSTSSEDRWRTTTAPPGAHRTKPATTRRTSPSSRASRPSASGRACTSARPGHAGFTTSSTRLSTTLLTKRWPATATTVLGHDPSGQLGHRRRQRPRDPGGDHGEGAAARGRGRADRAARRRQVRRRRRLQGLRRPARRRRLGRQRAVRAPRRRGPPRRLSLEPDLRARQASGPARARRADRGDRAPRSRSCPTPTSSRRSSTTSRCSRSGCARPRS